MATATVDLSQVMPAGTSVGAYRLSFIPNGPPVTVPVATVTTTSAGVATFTGLIGDLTYVAGASVGGTWRYAQFRTPASASGLAISPTGVVTDTDINIDIDLATQAELNAAGGGGGGTIPIFNAADYGADFSGFHSLDPAIAAANTTALNACIAAAQAHDLGDSRFGAIVQLPAGVAIVSDTISVPGGIWLRGAGPGLTEFYAAGWNANPNPVIKIDTTGSMAKISDLSIGCPATGFGINTAHGIQVDGGVAAFGELGGIVTELERIVIIGVPGYGVHLSGVENRMLDVYARALHGGFYIAGTDVMVANCTADTCGADADGTGQGAGFLIATSNTKFSNCKAFGCKGSGFNIGGARNMFASCEAQDNSLYGFNDAGGDNMFSACLADTNGQGGGTTYGFELLGGSVAAGCVAMNRAGSPQDYGYHGTILNGVYPQVNGMSRLPGTAHVAPGSVGSFNINNLRGSQPVTYAATITPDPYLGGTMLVGSLTGNVTINAPTSGVFTGMQMTFVLPQDATGGRTVTFAATYKTTAAITTTLSTTTTISFVYDGTNWRETARTVTT